MAGHTEEKAERKLAQVDESRILLDLDGPEVTPDTVDTLALLRLGESYFELLVREAVQESASLSLRGLAVVDKCVALAVNPDSADVAKRVVRLADEHVTGVLAVPAGLEEAVVRVRRALGRLPDGVVASVVYGPWKKRLAVETEVARTTPAVTSLRAVLIRVGGITPRARFGSASESRDFSLLVERETAKELGLHLYQDLSVVARVVRDREGHIDSDRSRLLEFRVERDGTAFDSWVAWYRENAAFWDDVEDIEAELGR